MKEIMLLMIVFIHSINGQTKLPEGVSYTCHPDSTDCSNSAPTDGTATGEADNPCCFSSTNLLLTTGSFTVGNGQCRPCTHDSVAQYSETFFCYYDSECAEANVNGNNNNDDVNGCCSGSQLGESYRVESQTGQCIPCYCTSSTTVCDPRGVVVGNDPHFFLPLLNKENLCFSVQGEPDFSFNLITDDNVTLNAKFVEAPKDESKNITSVSTFLGSLGLVVRNSHNNNSTAIMVSAREHSVTVDNSITIIKDKSVKVHVADSVTITVDEKVQTKKLLDESAWLYISSDAGFGIKVKYYKEHLDMFFTDTSGLSTKTHGLIGQFLGAEVEVDTAQNMIQFNNRKPIAVKQAPAWAFLGISEVCWYSLATDNQGGGVIEGVYTDYISEYLIPPKN